MLRLDGGATLPQHELEACNGGGAGARENLPHVLHQTQAVLCVQPEAVRQLPLLDTGRALGQSSPSAMFGSTKNLDGCRRGAHDRMERFAVPTHFRPERRRRRATYQVPPHHDWVPLRINASQEAQQQGVAHPLGPVVAAVALPAAAGTNKKQAMPDEAAASPFDPIDATG